MKNGKMLLLAVLLLFLFVYASKGYAGFIEIIGLDPRSAAMGGAACAVADTPSAWYYNPAGLAQIRGGWQELGLSQIAFFGLKERDPNGGEWIHDTTPVTYNAHFPGCDNYGLKDITIGLGGGATFGGGSFWKYDEGNFRYTAYETLTLINTFAPTVAWKVNSWLMVGAGANIVALNKMTNRAKLGDGFLGQAVTSEFLSMLGITPPRKPDALPFLSTVNGRDDGKLELWTDDEFPTGLQPTNDMDIDFRHVTFNVGVLARVTDKLRIGVTYRGETKFNYEGQSQIVFEEDAKASVNWLLDPLGMGIRNEATRFHMKVVMPRMVVAGIAYQFTDRLLVAFDFEWANWSEAWDTQTTVLEGDGLLGMTEIETPRDFKDTYSYRIGAEYNIWKGLRGQVGYFWDPTPVPNSTLGADTVDSDRHTFSCGLGYYGLFNGVLDITSVFQYIHFMKRTIEPHESANLGGLKRFVSYGPTDNDFALEFGGYVINVGLVLGVHY